MGDTLSIDAQGGNIAVIVDPGGLGQRPTGIAESQGGIQIY